MNPAFVAVVAIPLLLLLALAHQFATAIGADTGPVFLAAVSLTFVTIGCAWAWFKIEVSWTIALPAYLVLAWPCGIRVLDNLAEKAAESFMYHGDGSPWYGTGWFQGGVELIFVAWFVIAIFARRNN